MNLVLVELHAQGSYVYEADHFSVTSDGSLHVINSEAAKTVTLAAGTWLSAENVAEDEIEYDESEADAQIPLPILAENE